MTRPSVLVVVVTRNSMPHVEACLASMFAQTYPNYRVLIVDSASSDGTVEYITAHFPLVQILTVDRNIGYRQGNRLGMASGDEHYVVVCNDDVEVDRRWLSGMVDAMERDPELGLVTPRILFSDDRPVVNVAGNVLHFSGLYGARGFGEAASQHAEPAELCAVSGCCFMIRRAVLAEIGGFSEDFDRLDTGWHASFEDVDLGWRAQLAGYRIGYVPDSVVYHRYEKKQTTPQMFCAHEWGRYLVVLRNYSIPALVLLIPVFLGLELLAWSVAVARGGAWIGEKRRLLTWLWTNRSQLWAMRERVQSLRRVPDHVIVARMSPGIRLAHLVGFRPGRETGQYALDVLLAAYYRVFLTTLVAIARLQRGQPKMRSCVSL